METKAKSLGIGGKMRYIYPNGHNYGAQIYKQKCQTICKQKRSFRFICCIYTLQEPIFWLMLPRGKFPVELCHPLRTGRWSNSNNPEGWSQRVTNRR